MRVFRFQTLLCATLMLLFAGFVNVASARIVPQKGIKGINLSMSLDAVHDAKGRPDREHVVSSEIIGEHLVLQYGRTRASMNGTGSDSRVIAVTTTDPRQRTRSGIGFGSTEDELVRRVQGLTCRTEYGFRHCFKGAFRPGERVTDFSISLPGHRVKRVTIGFVVD